MDSKKKDEELKKASQPSVGNNEVIPANHESILESENKNQNNFRNVKPDLKEYNMKSDINIASFNKAKASSRDKNVSKFSNSSNAVKAREKHRNNKSMNVRDVRSKNKSSKSVSFVPDTNFNTCQVRLSGNRWSKY